MVILPLHWQTIRIMKREKEINKAAKEYCQKNIRNLPQMHLAIETAFEAGAKWAEEHPSWKNITKVWNLATKTAIAQLNREIPYFKSENEIKEYIKKHIRL